SESSGVQGHLDRSENVHQTNPKRPHLHAHEAGRRNHGVVVHGEQQGSAQRPPGGRQLSEAMTRFLLMLSIHAAIWGQGAGGVQFRDWAAPTDVAKPKMACAELRSLTNYEMSVIAASVIRATADTPEHCRVSVFIAPALNIEVNLP